MHRRHFLSRLATTAASSAALAPLAQMAPLTAWAAAGRSTLLAAAWDDAAGRHFAGIVELTAGAGLRVRQAIELPTRAHGLQPLPDGSLIVAARRPGAWLLRWRPGQGQGRDAAQWRWSEPDRRGCGHVVATPDGALLCSESDLADQTHGIGGAGLVVRRDARTLDVLDEWPSHGIDPHELRIEPDGSLLVANGGVPTRPETGRAKVELARMDSSLVRLAPDGRRLGQWRLADPRLSLRHLARHADGTVAIALQAEHDDPAERATAPCLALFDGQALRPVIAPLPLAGYGGSVAADAGGFTVAATRADRLARYTSNGQWRGDLALPQACALASGSDELLLAAGSTQLMTLERGDAPGAARARPAWPAATLATSAPAPQPDALQLDNHWTLWPHALPPA